MNDMDIDVQTKYTLNHEAAHIVVGITLGNRVERLEVYIPEDDEPHAQPKGRVKFAEIRIDNPTKIDDKESSYFKESMRMIKNNIITNMAGYAYEAWLYVKTNPDPNLEFNFHTIRETEDGEIILDLAYSCNMTSEELVTLAKETFDYVKRPDIELMIVELVGYIRRTGTGQQEFDGERIHTFINSLATN